MSNSRTDATTTAVKTLEPEALAETAREVACQKVGQCFTQGTDVLLIARAVKAAKYAYIAAATARDKEIEELRAEVSRLTTKNIGLTGYDERRKWEESVINEMEAEIATLRARVAELEGYLSKAQVALVYFTRVRGDRILDRDCNWLMLDSDMKEAIINAHNKEHND